MPIIQAPAHEYSTLHVVVQHCMHVSAQLGQTFTVITVDQALCCRLMELKWLIPEYKERLIPRLGGLNTSMNFLQIIGHHMQGCGLLDIWVETGLMGPLVAEQALAGKHYNKAMRAHKLTLQYYCPMFSTLLSLMHLISTRCSPHSFNETSMNTCRRLMSL